MRPALEYASSIWSPLASSSSINRRQVIQNAALRTVTEWSQELTYNICMPKHSHFPYTSTYSSTPHNTNRKHNIHHTHYTNTQHTSTFQAKNTIINNGGYTNTFLQTSTHSHYNTHIHTLIVFMHLSTKGNNTILCTPPPHIISSEEILPASLVEPLPNSEQIYHTFSNYTHTRPTKNHINHHYASYRTLTHTIHINSLTAPTYAPRCHPWICELTQLE